MSHVSPEAQGPDMAHGWDDVEMSAALDGWIRTTALRNSGMTQEQFIKAHQDERATGS